jgi:hypothetical protein
MLFSFGSLGEFLFLKVSSNHGTYPIPRLNQGFLVQI